VANAGVIEATGGGLTIDGAVANNRVLETFNSNLTITGAVTGIGAAELLGKGGLEVDGAFAQRVTFVHGSTATLVLGDSAGFTGSVVGLSKTGANHIDLKDVAFDATDTAVYTPNRLAPARGGVLRIFHGTTVLATVRLGLTDYTGQTFHLTNDGSGGTLITDPKTAALASHIASFAPGGGHSASPATAPAFTPHMLAMAHA
jgi:hypothetical protein